MNNELKFVSPFKKLCITIGNLPTAYLESMSYYEGLTYLVNFLANNVIPTVNNNSEVVAELQEKFVELKNYVDNYFENLDVQEEINNKLDEMAESGQLTDIIAQYLGLAGMITFNNVSEMKQAENLVNGSKCQTLGFHTINDGGGAIYRIREIINTDVLDEATLISLINENLVAELIIDNNTINFNQLGAKSNDDTFDNKTYMEKYINKCKKDNNIYKLQINPGNWYFSPTLISNFYGVNIEGVEVYSRGSTSPGVNICPLTNNQNYIWKLGGKADYTDTTTNTIADYSTEFKISGLNFTTYYPTTSYEVAQGMLIIDCLMYSNFKSIYFSQFKGNGLILRNSWELFFDYLSFRGQWGVTNTCILADNAITTTGTIANISALDIYQILFENTQGQYIKSMPNSGFSHNHISHINSETTLIDGTTIDSDVSSYIPIDLITGFFRNLIIDSINFIYNTPSKLTIDGNTYYYRSLIGDNPDISLTNFQKIKYITITSLSLRLGQEINNFSIMYGKDSYVDSNVSFSQIDVWLNSPNIPFYLEGSKAPYIGNYNDRALSLARFPNSNSICEFTELYPFANYMTIYDSSLPTKLKLASYNSGESSTNTNVFSRINKVCDSQNTVTVHMLVKNLASSTITCNLSYTQNGALAYKVAQIPVSNDVQVIKFENIWFDLNSLFRLNHGAGALECIGFYITDYVSQSV